MDKHEIANSTFIFAFLFFQPIVNIVAPSRLKILVFLIINPFLNAPLNAARNAQSTVAPRKASTRTLQPQDKPKEGECPDEMNIANFALDILL